MLTLVRILFTFVWILLTFVWVILTFVWILGHGILQFIIAVPDSHAPCTVIYGTRLST